MWRCCPLSPPLLLSSYLRPFAGRRRGEETREEEREERRRQVTFVPLPFVEVPIAAHTSRMP